MWALPSKNQAKLAVKDKPMSDLENPSEQMTNSNNFLVDPG